MNLYSLLAILVLTALVLLLLCAVAGKIKKGKGHGGLRFTVWYESDAKKEQAGR